MKKYQSHKVVEAGIIAALALDEDGSGIVIVDGVEYDVPAGFRRPGATVRPHAGDYFVRYQPDGYLSWSPKAVFEAGYREVNEPGTPAAVEVTVTAPAGKRAEVCHGAGETQSMFTVTERQSQTWSVMKGERLAVRAGDVLEVAHKGDAG